MENNLLTFEYWIEFREGAGYRRTMETDEQNEITLQIKAKNRATADRMIKALIAGNDSIVDHGGVCLE